jgi:glycine cleavage system H protein
VEFPEIGDGFAKAEPFGVVESVKAAADINMPIGGKVVMTNDALENAPELINSDAYDKGWLIRIRPSDLSEMDDLMDASAYAQYCAERE